MPKAFAQRSRTSCLSCTEVTWGKAHAINASSARKGQDKDRESKTWLSEDTGPITSVAQLLGQAARFQLKPHEAIAVLNEVVEAVKQWRDVALTADVGLPQAELEDLAPAFEHAGLDEALALLA